MRDNDNAFNYFGSSSFVFIYPQPPSIGNLVSNHITKNLTLQPNPEFSLTLNLEPNPKKPTLKPDPET